jgi:hypothetical protein
MKGDRGMGFLPGMEFMDMFADAAHDFVSKFSRMYIRLPDTAYGQQISGSLKGHIIKISHDDYDRSSTFSISPEYAIRQVSEDIKQITRRAVTNLRISSDEYHHPEDAYFDEDNIALVIMIHMFKENISRLSSALSQADKTIDRLKEKTGELEKTIDELRSEVFELMYTGK